MFRFISAGLLLCTLSLCFAQPAPPNFFARVDTFGTGCLQFGSLLVGDLNNDGFPDLVCSSVLLGNGNGTFTQGAQINLGSYDPIGLGALADVNGDGNLDIVYPLLGSDLIFGVSLGNGDGTFQPTIEYSSQVSSGDGIFLLAVGDFDGDGNPDVAEMGNTNVVIFLRDADAFVQASTFAVNGPPGEGATSFVVADFNSDGHLDLLVSYSSAFVVLLGNGDGTFQPALTTSMPFPHFAGAAVAVGDVNGDGIPDVAVTDNAETLLYIGVGDGRFDKPKLVNLPGGDYGLILADMNGDGILDLINNEVEVAIGQGSGTFGPPVYWPVAIELGGGAVSASDLRNIGRKDLITDYGLFLSVLLNTSKGAFRDGVRTTIPGGDVSCAATADFNGDGVPDIVAANASGIQIMLGTGKIIAPFEAGEAYPVVSPLCPVVGDLNGDGIPDLLVPSGPYGGAGSVIVYLGNGDGTFRQGPASAVSNVQTFALGDFNGDGKLDYANTSNLLAYGKGDGSFGTPGPYIPSISPNTLGFYDIVVADLTGKSKPDIILNDVEENGQMLYVLYNEGTAGWKQEIAPANCIPTYSLSVNYVHGAREPDIAGSIAGGMSVLVSNAAGTLSADACLEVSTLDTGLPLVADINGDGIADAIWFEPGDAAVYLGTGHNKFEANPLFIGTGTSPAAAFALNMHHQSAEAGKPDLIEIDSSGVIYTLINETK